LTNPPLENSDRKEKSSRRKLWQLPSECSDLLVMSSHSIESMRLLAQKGLARIGGGPCRLTGRNADLIYSVSKDFGTRNALSEIFQRDFETRHKTTIAELSSVKTPDQLIQIWAQLVDSECSVQDIGSNFWAMLTHPCGADIQGGIIYEMRAWVLGQMRSSSRYKKHFTEQSQRILMLQNKSERNGCRVRQIQTSLDCERRENLRLVCEINGLLQRTNALTLELQQREFVGLVADKKINGKAVVPQKKSVLDVAYSPKPNTKKFFSSTAPKPLTSYPIPTTHGEHTTTQTVDISGKRILCVGGLTGSQPLYRKALESAGGHCQFHDGGLEDSVQRLPIMIDSADVVFCQTGCINHEAYQQVKRQCHRTGKLCIYVERPSVSQLRKFLATPPSGSIEVLEANSSELLSDHIGA
jgi:Uncharacterized protein conserved in bacteria (DUF2325)